MPALTRHREYLLHTQTQDFMARVEKAKELISRHLDNAYIAISGGKDSAVLAHLAHCIDPLVPMYSWMDDLEWPETSEMLEQYRSDYNWNIHIIRRNGLWDRLVKIGKSPFVHNYFYDSSLLPESRRDPIKCYKTVFLGLRADESKDRFRNATTRGCQYVKRDGVNVVAPLQWWEPRDVFAYLLHHAIPIHPIYSKDRFNNFDPGVLRVSWWIPSPAVSRHGYCVWLRHYYPDKYNLLANVFSEARCYV